MTSLTTSPVMVALVQTASTLPMFLIGLPSGALADILDRRCCFAATQLWVSAIALVLAALSLGRLLTAEWLLVLTFANGIGLVMRWPVFAAIVPKLVNREMLPQALALNGIAMNLSRVVGPVLAGHLHGDALLHRRRRRRGGAVLPALARATAATSSCASARWCTAALSTLVVAVPVIRIALPAMVLLGMAWISVANSLTVSAQAALPSWVRARGMAICQMALMGGAAAGSILWGQGAGLSGVRWAVVAAAAFGVLVLLATRRVTVEGAVEPDFSPAPVGLLTPVAIEVGPDERPVKVTVEYLIDPARAGACAEVMQRTRRARLRQGALSWGLFRDTGQPGRYVEYFVDENWVEHQRRLERFTAFDPALRAQRLAFHLGDEPPLTRRYVADSLREPPGRPL